MSGPERIFTFATVLDPALALRQIEDEFAKTWAAIGSGGGGGGIGEAPIDGGLYGRQNAGWSTIPQTGGGIPEAPTDGLAYGRQSSAWTQVLMSSGDIVDGGNF